MILNWQLKPRKIAIILLVIACVIAGLSIVSEYLVEVLLAPETGSIRVHMLDLFSVNLEESIPTWYSVILLSVAATLFALITYAKYTERDNYRAYWAGLVVLFIYLSMDEGAAIHEIVADPMQQLFNTSGFFAFGWQLVAFPILAILGLIYIRFFLHLPSRTRNLFLLSAAIYAGGALIIEGFSAAIYDVDGTTMTYLLVATLEETMEILGVSLLIVTLLDYCIDNDYGIYIGTANGLSNRIPEKSSGAAQFPFWRILSIVVLSVSALFVVAWYWGDEPTGVVELTLPFYHPLDSDLQASNALILELPEVFSINSGLSREIAYDALQHYQQVTIVVLPANNQSVLFAADALSFDSQELSELLHDNGIIEFVIYETDAVTLFTSPLGA